MEPYVIGYSHSEAKIEGLADMEQPSVRSRSPSSLEDANRWRSQKSLTTRYDYPRSPSHIQDGIQIGQKVVLATGLTFSPLFPPQSKKEYKILLPDFNTCRHT